MPAGLQAWNASGEIAIDTSDEVGRIRGTFTQTTNTSGSQAISKVTGESYFAFMTLTSANGKGTIVLTATGFDWTFNGTGTARVFYGVY